MKWNSRYYAGCFCGRFMDFGTDFFQLEEKPAWGEEVSSRQEQYVWIVTKLASPAISACGG